MINWPLWTIAPASILSELGYVSTAAATIEFSIGPEALLAIVLVLVLLFWAGTRRMKVVPRGLQNVLESVIEFLVDFVEGVAGKKLIEAKGIRLITWRELGERQRKLRAKLKASGGQS